MRKFRLSLLMAGVLAGCTDLPAASDLATSNPPSLETIKAEIDFRLCRGEQDQIVFPPKHTSKEFPEALSGCAAYIPQNFLTAHIQASCGSMFDLDDAGAPINIDTRCTVGSVRAKIPENWASLAKAGYIYSASRQTELRRYPTKAATQPGQRRENLWIATSFVFGGEHFAVEPLTPFQRPSPAPPLPDDLLAVAARIAGSNQSHVHQN